jgi:hypothetical protein
MLPTVVIPRTHSREPLLELDRLAREIEDDLLSFASDGARAEWSRFKELCSTAAGAKPRGLAAPENELPILVDKARRFRAVLLLSA